MVDTVRTNNYLLTSEFQDGQAPASIVPQFVRDLIVSLSPPETTLTYAATQTWNLDANPVTTITLGGNITLTVTNGEVGKSYRCVVIQDGTGNRVVTLVGVTTLGVVAWQTAAAGVNILSIDYSGSTRYATVL